MKPIGYANVIVRDEGIFAVYDDETELPISPDKIRQGGWIPEDDQDPCEREHCDERGEGYCSCGPLADEVTSPLKKWHNDVHPGVFRFCDERPCSDVREELRDV